MENIITSIKDRVLQIIEYKNVSKESFFREIGMSSANFRGKAKDSPLNSNAISKINLLHTDISLEWLVLGIGEMYKNEKIEMNINKIDKEGLPQGAVPYYNLPVSAGHSVLEIEGAIKPDGYIKDLPGVIGTEAFLPVMGYSMYPEIKEGAIIGVKKISRWDSLNTQNKYLIITNDDRMVKYIEDDDIDPDILWCYSPNYKKFKIFKEDIIEINRVTLVINPQ